MQTDQPVLLVVLLLLLEIRIIFECFVHLVQLQFHLVVKDVFGNQIRDFYCHVALVVVEKLAGVVWLESFDDCLVDQVADHCDMLL